MKNMVSIQYSSVFVFNLQTIIDLKYYFLPRFTKLDWKATVAVFVDGKEWQLKGWPFKSHGQLFNAIRGFHIYMDNLKPHPNCEQWSVEKMVYEFLIFKWKNI